MTNKNVNITLRVKEDDVKAIAAFNLKNNLTKLDLKHLPFNKFRLEYQPKEEEDKEQEYKRLRERARAIGISEDNIDKVIEKWNSETKVIVSEVLISRNIIEVKAKSLFVAEMKFESSDACINDVFQDAKGFKYKVDSQQMKNIIESDPLEKESFIEFMLFNFADVLRILIYITSDKKINIKASELYNVKCNIEKVQKRKKKNGKKAKGSNMTLIKNYIYEMPMAKTLENMNKHTPRQYERQTKEWFTKGHWRTYRNGKRVWIKPTVKKGRNLEANTANINKTYIVNI